MQWLFKIGNKKPVVTLEDRLKYWTDGQLVDIRPSGLYKPMKGFLLIEDGLDFWTVRGDTNWKSTKPSVYKLKKLLSVPDTAGKYKWEFGYDEKTKLQMVRHRFIDYKQLLDAKIINDSLFHAIYDKKQAVFITLVIDVSSFLLRELIDIRFPSEYSDIVASVSSGTYQVGTGGGADYATVIAFEADIAAQLTGNLTGEHQNEETAIAVAVTFDTDTNTHLLKLTAESGAEHNGGAYGNGARIALGAYDDIKLDETNDGDLDDVEISKLALSGSGVGNRGVYFRDGGNSGTVLFNRLLVEGDANSTDLIDTDFAANNLHVRNCIVYGASGSTGISLGSGSAAITAYNNTVIGCSVGIGSSNSNKTIKNNLCQANTTDYSLGGDAHAKNVSEDATSPDAAYQSKDVHTNSVFKDYANDDYRLDSNGDVTNLAILDDGDDLSGTFTDDIEGQTRSTWYIGASEIVAVGAAAPTAALYGPLIGPLGGPI